MLALRHLKYFVAISEETSFVSAAKKLNTVQSSLSQQMKDLEDFVGVDLFERGSRIISLTKAGEVFLIEAKKALIEAEKAQNLASKLKTKINEVKIGVLIGAEVKIPRVILDAIKDNDAAVKVEIISEMGPSLILKLEKGEIDLAFTRSDINNEEIKSHECLEEDLMIVLPKDHELNKYSHIPIKELDGLDFIMPSVDYAPELRSKILSIVQDHNVELNVVAETENAFVTMSYVNMGMGITILPDYIYSIATNEVMIKKFLRIEPKVKLFLNYRNTENPALDVLLSMIRKGS
ncbi:LysR substrate-binding domain-containing protein [Acinetobacter wuhouensis]|uniref:LysR substrate-binding domain-containing protein n=1 Tax=Acinetobacter wuhouensis TaxID=1879050 RepID=UPI0013EE42D9|nr:LysR substrate-binding domain-containing protein [Acinetobacter wuhouensis]